MLTVLIFSDQVPFSPLVFLVPSLALRWFLSPPLRPQDQEPSTSPLETPYSSQNCGTKSAYEPHTPFVDDCASPINQMISPVQKHALAIFRSVPLGSPAKEVCSKLQEQYDDPLITAPPAHHIVEDTPRILDLIGSTGILLQESNVHTLSSVKLKDSAEELHSRNQENDENLRVATSQAQIIIQHANRAPELEPAVVQPPNEERDETLRIKVTDLERRTTVLEQENLAFETQNTVLQKRCANDQTLRKDYDLLVGELFSIRTNIWSMVRIRNPTNPLTPNHALLDHGITDNRTISLFRTPSGNFENAINTKSKSARPSKSWTFDHIFDEEVSNRMVYQMIMPMVAAALDGVTVSIAADGQSGAGKTHTMFSGQDSVAVSAAAQFFAAIDARATEKPRWQIRYSALEVFEKTTTDLLHEHATVDFQHINGASVPKDHVMEIATSLDNLRFLIEKACTARRTRPTEKNPTSSRSHCICTMELSEFNSQNVPRMRSKLHLVDLAGSESLSGNNDHDHIIEHRFIRSSRESFRCAMLAVANHKKPSRDSTVQAFSLLFLAVSDSFTVGQSAIRLFHG